MLISLTALAVTLAGFVGSGIQVYRVYWITQEKIAEGFELKTLAGTIIHLDEVLTMSARMAAVTGDAEWEARYRQFEPVLDHAIKRALVVGGESVREAITLTDVANLKLVAMETRALELVRGGDLAQAQALLFSDEYELQKQVYSDGIVQATRLLAIGAEAAMQRQWRTIASSLLLACVLLIVLLAILVRLLWMMRSWQQVLQAQVSERTQQLRQVNEGLAATNAELMRRERVMQSLLEDLEQAKQRIEQQAKTLQVSNEKLRELSILKDEFVAKVSHELRTPLTSVKEGLSLLLDRALGEITPDQQDFLSTMDGDIDRLTELINNMLDLAKIEAGRMRLVRARVDIREILESLVRSYQPIVGGRLVRVEVSGVPPIFGDANRIIQILTNLFSNALKFTPADGTITFRAEVDGGMAAIHVQDTGSGIAPEDLTKLFQKFSQVGTQRRGTPRGTGLGLVVCRELAELQGGRVDVASTLGQGTTFTVRLPLYSDAVALAESFSELQDVAATEGFGVGLLAIPTQPEALERRANEVRQHVHRGDIVLTMQPSWIVVMAAVNGEGLDAIVKRLRTTVPGASAWLVGTALAPRDGLTAPDLLRVACQLAEPARKPS